MALAGASFVHNPPTLFPALHDLLIMPKYWACPIHRLTCLVFPVCVSLSLHGYQTDAQAEAVPTSGNLINVKQSNANMQVSQWTLQWSCMLWSILALHNSKQSNCIMIILHGLFLAIAGP